MKQSNEEKITINLSDYYKPRPYQMPIWDAFDRGYKRILAVLPRRAGKDVTCWNLMIEQAMRKPAIYWYMLPTYSQARKVIWNGKLIDGRSFIDCIPPQVLKNVNQSEMIIKLVNGSLIQILGASEIDRLMGSNPYGIVFSEYAMIQDTRVFPLLLPILRASDGWAIFISTPRGKNNFYDMFQIAQHNPQTWFSYRLTVEDTQHIPISDIEQDIAQGNISYDMAKQEYWCSWDMGISGVVLGSSLDNMIQNNQITSVPWLTEFPVHTSWDIGNDTTAITFFQTTKTAVHVIDYYQRSSENLEHYVNHLKSRPYTYGKHFFPHDMAVKEWAGPRISRLEKARQLGIVGELVDNVSLDDGIEVMRSTLAKVYIDQDKCKQLIKCLENYRYEWNDKKQVYSKVPIHNWASHGADSFRYMCLSLPKMKDGMTQSDVDKLRREAVYKEDSLPSYFYEGR